MRSKAGPRPSEVSPIRQQAILDQGRLDITAVLGEAALRQAVGGAAVMRQPASSARSVRTTRR